MLSTYRTGLLQAKAYRTLRHYLSEQLSQYELTMPQWACLGLVYDAGSIRLADIASMLDVEPPFATALVDQLVKKGLFARKENKLDRRARLISLTAKGSKLVPDVETNIKNALRKIYSKITPAELGVYIKVLEAITVSYL